MQWRPGRAVSVECMPVWGCAGSWTGSQEVFGVGAGACWDVCMWLYVCLRCGQETCGSGGDGVAGVWAGRYHVQTGYKAVRGWSVSARSARVCASI